MAGNGSGGRPPGYPKTGGRKKGYITPDTSGLVAALEAAGYSPVAELIRVSAEAWKEYERASEIFDAIQDKRVDQGLVPLTETLAPTYLKIAQSCAADIMPYVYPRRKSVDVNLEAGQTLGEALGLIFKKAIEAEKKTIVLPANERTDGQAEA